MIDERLEELRTRLRATHAELSKLQLQTDSIAMKITTREFEVCRLKEDIRQYIYEQPFPRAKFLADNYLNVDIGNEEFYKRRSPDSGDNKPPNRIPLDTNYFH